MLTLNAVAAHFGSRAGSGGGQPGNGSGAGLQSVKYCARLNCLARWLSTHIQESTMIPAGKLISKAVPLPVTLARLRNATGADCRNARSRVSLLAGLPPNFCRLV